MNKNTKGVLIISLVLVVLIGLIIFFLSKKLNNNPPSNKTNKSEKETIELLSNTFNLYAACQTGKEFNFTNGIATIDELNDENINHILFNYLYNTGYVNQENKEDNLFTHSFLKQDLLEAAKKVFGEAFANSFNPPSTMKINGANYELRDDKYIGSSFVNACLHLDTTNFYYNGYTKDKDVYRISYILYYAKHKLENDKIITYVYNNKNSDSSICLESEINNNTDKFTEYSFVFSKNNDSFIFDHIELVNKA